jgi:hypothetical protein
MAALDGWKNINNKGQAVRQHENRVETEKKQDKFEKKSSMQKSFSKAMTGKSSKTSGIKTPEKPIIPKDLSAKAKTEAKKQTFKDHNPAGRAKAQEGFQKAKNSLKTLKKVVYKTSEQPKPGKKAETEGLLKQQMADPKGKKAAQATAKEAPQVMQQAKPLAKKMTQLNKKVADNSKVHEGKDPAKARAKKVVAVKEGDKQAVGKDGKPASEAGQRIAGQAGIAHGAKQVAKDGGKFGDDAKVDNKKRKRLASAKGSKVGSGPSEANATRAELGSVLSGEAGSESPFDLEQNEVQVANVDYEPVVWETGSKPISNIKGLEKFNEVHKAAKEHEQRTIKPTKQEVDYANWTADVKPIGERISAESLVKEIAVEVEIVQRLIRSIRDAKDPRNIGKIC